MSQARKNAPKGSAGGINLGLIITPMLDMSFQILAFFIMTYHPSALEGHIPGLLAPPESPAVAGKNPLTPALEFLTSSGEDALLKDLQDVVLVKIKAVAQGQEEGQRKVGEPRQLFLQAPLETEAKLLADVDGDFSGALKQLAEKLKETVQKKDRHNASIKIVADSDLRQQYVLRVYDVCKQTGFAKIYFVPPPKLK